MVLAVYLLESPRRFPNIPPRQVFLPGLPFLAGRLAIMPRSRVLVNKLSNVFEIGIGHMHLLT
jgi:hypothetical protein